jgi:cell division protein FtsB
VKKQQLVTWVLVVLLAISQYKLWFGDYGVLWLNRLKSELNSQTQENNKLIKRNEALNAQLQEFKTGKEALEERARSQLGMIKDGEIFIQETQPSKK